MALSNLKYAIHTSGGSTLEGKDIVKGDGRRSRFACAEFECSARKLIVYHANCERISLLLSLAGKHPDNIFDFARTPRAMHADRLCSKGGKEGDGRDISKWVNGSVARKASLISGVEPCAMAFRRAPRLLCLIIIFLGREKNSRGSIYSSSKLINLFWIIYNIANRFFFIVRF